MKKYLLFFVSLLLLVGSAAAADVVITPSNPDTDDDLRASVDGYESTTFDYFWMKDGAQYYESTGYSSTLDASYTDGGDTWTVSVWVPASAWYDSYEYGSETITISADSGSGEIPDFSDGTVVIDPANPCDEDDLTGYVAGYESTAFDFVWMQNGATYKEETATSSTVYDAGTDIGDTWTLSVWVPASAWYDTFEYGSASVTIADCSEPVERNHVPRAHDIHFMVTEGDVADADMVQGSSLIQQVFYSVVSEQREMTTIHSYDADGDALSITYNSLFDANGQWRTAIGGDGVYTATATISDGEDSTTVDITVTVEAIVLPTETEAPQATDIYLTVTEGDAVAIDVTYTDSSLDFGFYQVITDMSESTTVFVFDADSAESELTYAFGSPLDLNGNWQTADGDAGVYTSLFTVTDADGRSGSATITITVEEACQDLNNNGVCDEDEPIVPPQGENSPPEVEPIEDVEVDEGETVTITVDVSDADGDAVICTLEGIPGTQNGNVWTWVTTYYDAGVYDVTVTCTDGEKSDSTTLTVTVNDVCDDFNRDNVCDTVHRSDYEGDLLTVESIRVLNANSLYSAYDVADLGVQTSGVFSVDNDGYLQSSASDNQIKVYLEMQNRNSFDARDIMVTFILDGNDYSATFSDLDRSEKESHVYSISIPAGLETGEYPLRVIIQSEAIDYETAFNLEIVSLGDYVAYEEQSPVAAAATNFWDALKSFFGSLF